jgi:hypothetical protein
VIDYEDFRRRVRALKDERWMRILNSEPPGRVPGRRPRDPEQERILTELDRRRIERSARLRDARRIPVERPAHED